MLCKPVRDLTAESCGALSGLIMIVSWVQLLDSLVWKQLLVCHVTPLVHEKINLVKLFSIEVTNTNLPANSACLWLPNTPF